MNPKPKQPTPSATTQIIQQVRRYQLTTPAVVAATLPNESPLRAGDRLRRLVARTRLYRYELPGSTDGMAGDYFTLRTRPLVPMFARACFAVLWYCQVEKPKRTLLSTSQVARLVEGMGIVKKSKVLSKLHIAVEPTRAEQTPRIEIIRVSRHATAKPLDAPAVHESLIRFVDGEQFSTWWRFAKAERLVLTYLVPHIDYVKTLEKYFDKRRLLSSVGGTPIAIPIRFAVARQLLAGRS